MAMVKVKCPYCGSEEVSLYGKNSTGKQRYLCRNKSCARKTFQWSLYHDKSHQIWLWWAIDHATNTPLAFTFGTREHKNLDDLLALLQPFPISTNPYQEALPENHLLF